MMIFFAILGIIGLLLLWGISNMLARVETSLYSMKEILDATDESIMAELTRIEGISKPSQIRTR
jgi:hypothetical protein